jgi:hypothetical protein
MGLQGGHAERGLVAVIGIQDHGIMRDVLENVGAWLEVFSTH